MGCDIHVYREVRDKDGAWQNMGHANKYFSPRWEADSEDTSCTFRSRWVPQPGRDYGLFAALGMDSRGYSTDYLEMVGLPDDISPDVADEAAAWAGDGHSHSHMTLKELDGLWEKSGGKFYEPGKEDGYEFDLGHFFVGWVDEFLRPWAWDGDDSVRLVVWYDN
jgi:hypothetical protein